MSPAPPPETSIHRASLGRAVSTPLGVPPPPNSLVGFSTRGKRQPLSYVWPPPPVPKDIPDSASCVIIESPRGFLIRSYSINTTPRTSAASTTTGRGGSSPQHPVSAEFVNSSRLVSPRSRIEKMNLGEAAASTVTWPSHERRNESFGIRKSSTSGDKQQLLILLRNLIAEAETALLTLYDVRNNLANQIAQRSITATTFGRNGGAAAHPDNAPILMDQAQATLQSSGNLIRQTIRQAQATEQDLLEQCKTQSDFAQCKRFQDQTQSLQSRYSSVTAAIENQIHQLRTQELLQRGSGGVSNRNPFGLGSDQNQRHLESERQALDSTVTVVSESIAAAKASFAGLRTQGNRLQFVGRKAGTMAKEIIQADLLMDKIKRLKLKHQLILAAVFSFCLATTLIAAFNKMA